MIATTENPGSQRYDIMEKNVSQTDIETVNWSVPWARRFLMWHQMSLDLPWNI